MQKTCKIGHLSGLINNKQQPGEILTGESPSMQRNKKFHRQRVNQWICYSGSADVVHIRHASPAQISKSQFVGAKGTSWPFTTRTSKRIRRIRLWNNRILRLRLNCGLCQAWLFGVIKEIRTIVSCSYC